METVTLYKVGHKSWDDRGPLRVSTLVVKKTKTGFWYVSGDRGPFNYRSRFGVNDFATSREDAIERFVFDRTERIEKAQEAITDMQRDLQNVEKLK